MDLGDFLEVVLTGLSDGLDMRNVKEIDTNNDSKFSSLSFPKQARLGDIC